MLHHAAACCNAVACLFGHGQTKLASWIAAGTVSDVGEGWQRLAPGWDVAAQVPAASHAVGSSKKIRRTRRSSRILLYRRFGTKLIGNWDSQLACLCAARAYHALCCELRKELLKFNKIEDKAKQACRAEEDI